MIWGIKMRIRVMMAAETANKIMIIVIIFLTLGCLGGVMSVCESLLSVSFLLLALSLLGLDGTTIGG